VQTSKPHNYILHFLILINCTLGYLFIYLALTFSNENNFFRNKHNLGSICILKKKYKDNYKANTIKEVSSSSSHNFVGHSKY